MEEIMKRILALFLVTLMSFSLSACGGKDNNGASKDGKYEIALVTDYGSVDDKSFNQGAWEGVVEYAKRNDKSYQYYRPTEKSTDAYLNAFQIAVKNGAKIIVCPGFLFEPAVFKGQDMYKDVKFVILDGTPQDGTYTEYKTAENTNSIVYAEEQPGFLAGYAAVMDGYRNLGFMGGMAVPAVVRFGYGYIQGAEYAAKELGLAPGSVKIKYTYTGGFDPMPEYQTKAASWYQSGTEVIFSCAALVVNNVTAAAEAAGKDKYVIGVDVDQKDESKTVITSAMKNLKGTVYNILDEFYNGKFRGGQNDVLGAESDAIGLPDDFSRFKKFTKEQYYEIYTKIKENKDNLATSIIKDTKDGEQVKISDIQKALTIVQVEEVK
jgi:basic membrane protein A